MKNFPHQFANLDKLTGALQVARDLIEDGDDLSQDGDYGEALARAGIYAFRAEQDIETLLAEEQQKATSNQGTRTAAREMRRFLTIAGFVEAQNTGWEVTGRGTELLHEANAQVRSALWREAMLAMPVPDQAGNVSHPYRILLRLVADNPGIETRKLMLALEARDDSAAEYQRISALLNDDYDAILAATGIGEANARNAVKILPAIAEQVGDIMRARKHTNPTAAIIVAEDGAAAPAPIQATKPAGTTKLPKAVTADTIAAVPKYQPTTETTKDMTATIELQKRRTKQHQALVQRFAQHLVPHGFSLFEQPFDCLARKDDKAFLVEAKTLDGSPSDERRQAEKALGQIRGYAHFDLPPDLSADKVNLLILFSSKPTDEMTGFLNGSGLAVAWPDDAQWAWSRADGVLGQFLG